MTEKVIIRGREYDPEWLDQNFLSDRWIKAKYKCTKETKGCAIISVWTKKAGRCKCIPCEFLEVTHPDGSVTTLWKGTVKSDSVGLCSWCGGSGQLEKKCATQHKFLLKIPKNSLCPLSRV